jgi:DNA repair protein SbcD/Mre11
MKFLYLTDTHFRSERPAHRIDDIYKNQFEELGEVSNLVLEHDVDFIVHGGDVFHHNRPSHELVRDLIGWARYTNVPIYVVPGNHDLSGYNPNSISSVGLGVLFESELFIQLDEKVFAEEKVYFKGVLPEVQPHNDEYNLDGRWDGHTRIIVSHNYISPTPLMFPYLPTKEVKTNAHLFLLGHLHEPSDVTIGNTRFINPGALARWGIDEANRIPTVLLIEIENGKIDVQHIPLSCAKKAEEIFDLTKVGAQKEKEDQLKSFMESLENTSFETNDIEQLVLAAGKNQGVEERILNKSLEKIREAKEVLK